MRTSIIVNNMKFKVPRSIVEWKSPLLNTWHLRYFLKPTDKNLEFTRTSYYNCKRSNYLIDGISWPEQLFKIQEFTHSSMLWPHTRSQHQAPSLHDNFRVQFIMSRHLMWHCSDLCFEISAGNLVAKSNGICNLWFTCIH